MNNDLDFIQYPVLITTECGESIAVATSFNNIMMAVMEHYVEDQISLKRFEWDNDFLTKMEIDGEEGNYNIELRTIPLYDCKNVQ